MLAFQKKKKRPPVCAMSRENFKFDFRRVCTQRLNWWFVKASLGENGFERLSVCFSSNDALFRWLSIRELLILCGGWSRRIKSRIVFENGMLLAFTKDEDDRVSEKY